MMNIIDEKSKLMTAVRLYKVSDLESIQSDKIIIPELENHDVLVKVFACSITRDELDWSGDRLPAIPSYEFSGQIVKVAHPDDEKMIGSQVFGLSSFSHDGAAAEYIRTTMQHLAIKPETLSYVQCASVPLAALSAWQGLIEYGNLQEGQTVLIHGATGGVGHFAVQIAKILGATVIGTISEENYERAQNLGVDRIIKYTKDKSIDLPRKVDLVFDTAGGFRLKKSLKCLKPNGKLVSIAEEPPQAESYYSKYFVVSPNSEQLNRISELLERKEITPLIQKIYPMNKAKEAFKYCMEHRGYGKIVLSINN